MKNKATKDMLRLKPEEEPAKKKSKKATKPKPSTPQQSTETEEEPVPMASSSAIELTKADDAPKQSKAQSLYELPGEAAEQAYNELIKAQAICLDDFKTQFIRNNTEAMVQILDLTAATVPFESHGLLKARDKLRGAAGSQSKGQIPQEPQQPPEQSHAKPSSSEISHTLCAWARYAGARHRTQGLTLDSAGRLSLNNIMEAWGKWQGLSEADILLGIQQHRKTKGEDRFATQPTPDDILIQVRAPRHAQQCNQQDAVASSRRQRHRRRS